MRQDSNQLKSTSIELFSECAVQLNDGLVQPRFASRLDEVRDCLRLRKIHSSVEKGSTSELPRFGHPGAESHRERCDPTDQVAPTMALQFRNILSGQAMGLREDDRHRTIELRASFRIDDVAKVESSWLEFIVS